MRCSPPARRSSRSTWRRSPGAPTTSSRSPRRCWRRPISAPVQAAWLSVEVGLKPIHTEADYEAALDEVGRLWGARTGTPAGDRLEVLVTLIEAYEARHYPMNPAQSGRCITLSHETSKALSANC